ncbi:MAG TPA: extracellular solute-binding protein [Gryllotalpicola sp.]
MITTSSGTRNEARRRAIRAVALTAAVAAGSVGLSACASSASDSSNSTLTMAMMTTYKPGLDKLIPQFEKQNPGITIKPTYYSPDVYAQTVPTQFTGGNGSDLVYLDAGTGTQSVARMGAAGDLADLSDQSWVSTMYPATKANYEVKGKVMARDLGISSLASLSYNTDYFSKNGLAEPTTFSQLLDLCASISSKGKIPIAWAAGSQAVNYNDVVSLASNTLLGGDPGWLQKKLSGSASFAGTPGWRQALQQVLDMKKAKCFSPGASSVTLDQMLGQFASGQAEMMFTYGGLNAAVLQQAPQLHVAMFAPPAETASDTWLQVQPAGGIGVWSKSQHKAAAEKFLDFISGTTQSRDLASVNQLISPQDAVANKLPDMYKGLLPYFQDKKTLNCDLVVSIPNSTEMTNDSGASIQGLFTGQKTIDQVLGDMDSAIAKKQ